MSWGLVNLAYSFSSVSPTQAHKHSSTVGDGGSLDSTTLINNTSLFALVVAGL